MRGPFQINYDQRNPTDTSEVHSLQQQARTTSSFLNFRIFIISQQVSASNSPKLRLRYPLAPLLFLSSLPEYNRHVGGDILHQLFSVKAAISRN